MSIPRGGGGPVPPNRSTPPLYSYSLKLMNLRTLGNQLSTVFRDYKGWISRNPGKASDVESFFKILAYLLPGRVRGNSTVIPELLYSTANLVSFLHDQILQKELQLLIERQQEQEQDQRANESGRRSQNGTATGASTSSNISNHVNDQSASRKNQIFKIRACLSILEYFEVFLEVAARRLWGDPARWIVVFLMQVVKACLRSVLVFYYKVGLTRSPAVPAFDRTKYHPNRAAADQNGAFVLKHTGRVIRKLQASPSLYSRDWVLPEVPLTDDKEMNMSPQNILAEAMHIARPLCHLMSLGRYGSSSWKPWLLSLAIDVGSLYLHGDSLKHRHRSDQIELQKRTMSLLLYLLRSPFYDNATKMWLISSLEGIGSRVPLIGNLFLLLAQAIPQWQQTYSYVWS